MNYDRTTDLARELYNTMPGTYPVPFADDRPMWGEVEDTDAFQFCLRIAQAIVEARY